MAARRRTTPSGAAPRPKRGGERPARSRTHEKNTKKPGKLPFIIAAAVLLAAAGVAAYLHIASYYTDEITPGVTINAVDVSGMTKDEALAALSAYAERRIAGVSVQINYEGRTWSYGAQQLGAALDFTEAVDRAAAAARTGGLSQRKAEAKAALAGQYQLDVPVTIRQDSLRECLGLIKRELDAPPAEPAMTMQCEGEVYTVAGYGGYQPGVDYSGLFAITPGITGVTVDVEATMNQVNQDLADDLTANTALVVNTQAPGVTEQDLRGTAVLLFHSSSKLNNSTEKRNTNIMLALSNFDGIVIEPGRQVSFNDTVGERTAERGYLEAKQIGANGVLETGFGGGVCQAATTLFNAIVNAGCQIDERNPHKWPLYFDDYDWGLDAMVDWESSDLKFTNTTAGPLYLDFYFEYAGGKPSTVNVDIYGMPFEPGVTVKMLTKKISEYPAPSPRYEYKNKEEARSLRIDEDDWKYDQNIGRMTYLKVPSRPGYVYRVYRVWYKDGEEFMREELYTTEYPAIQGIIYTKNA